jgi:hypothetical protein
VRAGSPLVKTLGYEVVGTMSEKRDEIDGGTALGQRSQVFVGRASFQRS